MTTGTAVAEHEPINPAPNRIWRLRPGPYKGPKAGRHTTTGRTEVCRFEGGELVLFSRFIPPDTKVYALAFSFILELILLALIRPHLPFNLYSLLGILGALFPFLLFTIQVARLLRHKALVMPLHDAARIRIDDRHRRIGVLCQIDGKTRWIGMRIARRQLPGLVAAVERMPAVTEGQVVVEHGRMQHMDLGGPGLVILILAFAAVFWIGWLFSG